MKWINVEDELPKQGECVIVIESDNSQYIGIFCIYEKSDYIKEEERIWSEYSTGCGCCTRNLKPTHWMPLPDPPTKE